MSSVIYFVHIFNDMEYDVAFHILFQSKLIPYYLYRFLEPQTTYPKRL